MMHRKLFLSLLLLLGLSWTVAAQIPPRPYASYLEYPKYGGTCELGIGQANDPFSQRVELLPAFGVKFSRYVFLGAGAGINYFSSTMGLATSGCSPSMPMSEPLSPRVRHGLYPL